MMALGGTLLTGVHSDSHFQSNNPSLEMAVIGNSAFSCIVDKTSKVVWACFPKVDGDPIFNCLLNNNSSVCFSNFSPNLLIQLDVSRVFRSLS